MKSKKIGVFLLYLMLMMVCTVSAQASDKTVFGGTFVLEHGETIFDDLVIFGGNVTIEKDATVRGDVAVFGGNLTVDGLIQGNVAAIGGVVKITERGVIYGDVASIGARVIKSPNAIVSNLRVHEFSDESVYESVTKVRPRSFVGMIQGLMSGLLALFMQLLILAVAALVAGTFLPRQMSGINARIFKKPVESFLLGLTAIVLVPCIVIALFLTFFLIPAAILICALFFFVCVFAWIVMGYEVGKRLFVVLKVKTDNVWLVCGGTIVLTLINTLFVRIIPCFGWMPGFVVLTIGLGGIILHYTKWFSEPPLPSVPALLANTEEESDLNVTGKILVEELLPVSEVLDSPSEEDQSSE